MLGGLMSGAFVALSFVFIPGTPGRAIFLGLAVWTGLAYLKDRRL
jgi:hypothetical protein